MRKSEVLIEEVLPGSIADEVGIETGDVLLLINGQKPKDLIDYRFICSDDQLEVEIQKKDGEVWVCEIEKDFDEDLGIRFSEDTFDGIRNCANRCIFCFIDQMPPGMRNSLYVKDDDYRLSFLHGNFVTLTNLTRSDLDRILQMRLSPLYISVHTTNPVLREEMLGNRKAGGILKQLTELSEAGIEMHTQIVLCPGVNDGSELDKTIQDLSMLWPSVKSVAIVPVGLTGYREKLRTLRKFTGVEAAKLVDTIHEYQKKFLNEFGTPLVYLADEFYVMAGAEFPDAEYYGDFPQLENGVGLARLFYESFHREELKLPVQLPAEKSVAMVTGVSGETVLTPVVSRLNQIKNLQVELIAVKNTFFGGHVTVTGLLTGRDVIEALNNKEKFDEILLPSVMCKRDEPVFLDGLTPDQLEIELETPVRVVDITDEAKELVETIKEYATDENQRRHENG